MASSPVLAPGAGCPTCGSLAPPVAWTGEETCPACGYVYGATLAAAAPTFEGCGEGIAWASHPLSAAPSPSLAPRNFPLQGQVTRQIARRQRSYPFKWLDMLRIVAADAFDLDWGYAADAFDQAERAVEARGAYRSAHLYVASFLALTRERKLRWRVDDVVRPFLPWGAPNHPVSVQLVMRDLYTYWPAARPLARFGNLGTGDHPTRRGYEGEGAQ